MALDNNDIQQLIALLQKLVINNQDENDVKPNKTRKPRIKKSKDSETPTNTKKKSTNKFNSMPEMHMFKEDTEIDKKLQKFPPTPRNRKFEFVKVQCRVCGKKDKVAPSLLETTERYKCNKCSTGAG